MAKKIVFFLLPVVFFVLLTVILFKPYFLQGKVPIPGDIILGHYHPWADKIWEGRTAGYPLKNFILFDGIRQTLPWRLLAIEQIKSGHLPLWNPYILGGMPLLGNLQAAVLYPFNFLFFLLPKLDAWTIYLFLQPILAGFLTYFFLRTLSCSRKSSLLGGTCFGFSLMMMNHLEFGIDGHTALWLPLALAAINKIQQTNKWQWGLVLTLSVVMTLLGGYPPLAIYNLMIIGFYTLLKIRPLISRKTLIIILCLVFAFLLAAPQILPFLELSKKVIREQAQFGVSSEEVYFLPFENLIMIIAPDFFGHPATNNFFSRVYYADNSSIGMVGFFLALFSLIWLFRKKEVAFWLFLVILPTLLMVETVLGRSLRYLPISFFSLVTPMRMVWVVSFALSILAGMGMEVVFDLIKKRKFWPFLMPIILAWEILFLIWVLSFLIPQGEHIQIAQRNLILPTFFLGLSSLVLIFSLFFRKVWPIAAGFLILFSGTELVRQGIKYNPFLPRDLVFPQTETLKKISQGGIIWRTLVTHPELLPVNSNIPYHLPMIDGYASIYDGRSGQMVHLANASFTLTKIEAYPRTVFQTEIRSKIIDLLNVKYVLALQEIKDEKLALVMKEGKTFLYENKKAFPKSFFTESYQIGQNDLEVANQMLKSDLSKKVILEKDPGLSLEKIKVGQVEIKNYGENEILIQTKNQGPGILVLTDSFDSGWQVFVDNQKKEVLRADFNLRAVVVPEGKHQIRFIYRSKSFKIGLYLSGVALLLILTGWIIFWKKKKL